ncbi:MAG: GNAT family N-acetyltransferase [Ignavibacteria bacterium]
MEDTDNIAFEESSDINKEELYALYNDAGWTLYTNDIDHLKDAVANSLQTITARSDGKLVGLIRCVGDGKTIIYIQDILVLREYKRCGIGTRLVDIVLKKYHDVRQIVLLTDDTEEVKEFYRSLGFSEAGNMKLVCFVKIRS